MVNRNRLLADNLIHAWNKGETGFFIQTSGSTGEPKGMMLEREKVIWSCNQTAKFLGILPTDSIYCCLPVNRIGGWMQVARALVWNIRIEVVEPASDPMKTMNGNYSITSLTPMQLHTILQDPQSRQKLNQFRMVLIGGGDLDRNLEQQLLGMGPSCWHTYGMTETYSHIALRKVNRESVFTVLPDTLIRVNDAGCLSISNFITNHQWLDTRDLAHVFGSQFSIQGRADNVVNSGGIKIQAEVIEKMLLEKYNLPEGSIFYAGIPDEKFGEKPVLYVNQKMIPSLPEIESSFKDMPFARPREIFYLKDFEYTETGKIQRKNTVNSFANPPKVSA